MSGEKGHFSGFHVETDITQSIMATLVALGNVIEPDQDFFTTEITETTEILLVFEIREQA